METKMMQTFLHMYLCLQHRIWEIVISFKSLEKEKLAKQKVCFLLDLGGTKVIDKNQSMVFQEHCIPGVINYIFVLILYLTLLGLGLANRQN